MVSYLDLYQQRQLPSNIAYESYGRPALPSYQFFQRDPLTGENRIAYQPFTSDRTLRTPGSPASPTTGMDWKSLATLAAAPIGYGLGESIYSANLMNPGLGSVGTGVSNFVTDYITNPIQNLIPGGTPSPRTPNLSGSWQGPMGAGLMRGVAGLAAGESPGKAIKHGGLTFADAGIGNLVGGDFGGMVGSILSSIFRVVCTELRRQDLMDKALYKWDIEFTQKKLSGRTVAGYHVWAIPYVRVMRRKDIWGRLATNAIRPLMVARALECAYQLGHRNKPHWGGRFVRLLVEPICWLLGGIAQDRKEDCYALWSERYK